MLSPEIYRSVDTALERLAEKNLPADWPTRQLLLSEFYATKKALDDLDITANGLPQGLPEINRLLFSTAPHSSTKPQDTIIEVVGMPRAGKTTIIEKATYRLGLTEADEKWRTLKARLDQTGLFDYFLMDIMKVGKESESLSRHFWQMEGGISPRRPLIMDRGLIDALVFLRANFLFGRISGEDFAVSYPVFQLPMAIAPDKTKIRKALILCLIPPEVSLEREGPREKPGRFMNPEFLKILYTQYLRLHAELLKGPRNLTYACLDLTSSYQENQELFEKTLTQILA